MAKAGSGNKGFSIDGFYVEGAIVYQTDAPPLCSKILLLRMQMNLGRREKSKMYWQSKKSDSLFQILFPFISSAFSAKSLQLKCCCKSEARLWLFFVCNDNKALDKK